MIFHKIQLRFHKLWKESYYGFHKILEAVILSIHKLWNHAVGRFCGDSGFCGFCGE